jgi:hypothetical protein
MLSETLKKRLTKDRPVTSITLRIPVDVVDSLKAIAPHKGFSGYQTLLKAYISEGLRRDESTYASGAVERLAQALEKRGVSRKVLDDALRASIIQGQASGPGRPAKTAFKRLDAKYRKQASSR